ncbi:unnamed protein product [Ilex paraguariensis]|uniref:TSL-kinase interacting protein 1 n=1 Tax=Ilex paraguariensis TaxID=185542 RepID=A0ABC8SGM1_9AQUA
MKSTRQQKGNLGDAPRKQKEHAGSAGVWKSTSKNGRRHQKVIGVLACSVSQVSGQQLPAIGKSFRETTKISKLELKTEKLHSSAKIKLQLFPIDEGTRIGLEKDGHNPFLELTLSSRKKISSVLKHLNVKWSSSSVAGGELILFPYNTRLENLATKRRWTSTDSGIIAGDVCKAIGSPAIFRLRYGWFVNLQPQTSGLPSTSTPFENSSKVEGIQKGCYTVLGTTSDDMGKTEAANEGFIKSINIKKAADAVVTEQVSLNVTVDLVDGGVKNDDGPVHSTVPWDESLTNLSIGGLLSEASLQGKTGNFDMKCESKSGLQPIQLFSDISVGALLSEASLQDKVNNCDSISNKSKSGLQPPTEKGFGQSLYPWDDSLTTLSIGGLLSEASLQGKINNCDSKPNGSKSGLQNTLSTSDSFDAFIAAQVNAKPQVPKPFSQYSHSSIFDAEETCHEFPFRNFSSAGKDSVATSGRACYGGCSNDTRSRQFRFPNLSEVCSIFFLVFTTIIAIWE